jgi:hypothetical protein
MRAHGLTNFPDPDANGGIVITGGPDSGLDKDSAQFKAALEACKQFQPTAGPGAPQQVDRDSLVKYAKCMRDNGIAKFPDPDPGAGIKLDPSVVDPNSPQFQAADKACAKYKPGGPGAPAATQRAGG